MDILCLQEVEESVFDVMRVALREADYEGVYARKGLNRPDGCATFFRTAVLTPANERRIQYADGNGGADSGHIGQLLTFEWEGHDLVILNTHLKWDPPGTVKAAQWGYRQIVRALAVLQKTGVAARIVCGDFNVTPASEVVETLLAAGMEYAHRDCVGIATCNSNRKAKLIDYLFYTDALQAVPVPPPAIDDDTVLPSLDEPSDHLPLIANFELVK